MYLDLEAQRIQGFEGHLELLVLFAFFSPLSSPIL
jgi:hypothetical protein